MLPTLSPIWYVECAQGGILVSLHYNSKLLVRKGLAPELRQYMVVVAAGTSCSVKWDFVLCQNLGHRTLLISASAGTGVFDSQQHLLPGRTACYFAVAGGRGGHMLRD